MNALSSPNRAGLRLISLIAAFVLAALASAQSHVKWSLSAAGSSKLVLHAAIDPGWHLYSTVPVKGDGPVPTTVTVDSPLKLAGKVTESKPITKLDPNFGLVVQYFEDKADFTMGVKGATKTGSSSITVRFQLCNDSMCIPPSSVHVTLGKTSSDGAAAAVAAPAPAAGAAPANDYSSSFAAAKAGGLLGFLGFSFVAGLLSLLTPCVFPMIPITVSFFTKRRATGSKGASLLEPVAYCGGIVGSFAIFGVAVSVLFGASGIQRFATNPYVNLVLAALFIVLALSLLGIYTISLPSSILNRFSGAQGKSGVLPAVIMGFTFTLTSFTCTVPFVGTILAGASQGDLLYPLMGMLSYGVAFASPFFALALFPQYLAKLPKSGSWLETVKAFMGFIEVAAALKFLSNADLVLRTNLLSRATFLGLWAAIALVAGLFLLGAVRLPSLGRLEKMGPVRAGFGVASLALAVWFVSSLGGRSLGELEAFMPPTDHGWLHTYEEAVALAKRSNKPIFINFTGVTCTNCRWMESNVFPLPAVKHELGKFVTVELYTDRETAGDAANKALQQELTGVVTLPEYVEVTPEGQKLKPPFQGSTRDTGKFVEFLHGSPGA